MFTLRYDLEPLLERLRAAQEQIPVIVEEGLAQLGAHAVLSLQDHCPVDEEENNGVISGEEDHLVNSFVAESPQMNGAQGVVEVRTLEPIKFSYVTEGTTAVIFPNEKEALWWPGAAHPVVNVSGQEPNPFDEEAQQEVESLVPDVGKEMAQKIIDVLRGV